MKNKDRYLASVGSLWSPFNDFPGFSLSTYIPVFRTILISDFFVNRLLPDPLFILFPELKQFPFHPFLDPSSFLIEGWLHLISIVFQSHPPSSEEFARHLSLPDSSFVAELQALPPMLRNLIFFLLSLDYCKKSTTYDMRYTFSARLFFLSWFLCPLSAFLFPPPGLYGFFRLRFPVQSILVPFFYLGESQGFAILRESVFSSLLSASFPRLEKLLLRTLPFKGEWKGQFVYLVDLLLKVVEHHLFCLTAVDDAGVDGIYSMKLNRPSHEERLGGDGLFFLIPLGPGFGAPTERMDAFFERACVEEERPLSSFDPFLVPQLHRFYNLDLETLFLSRYVDPLAYLGLSPRGLTQAYSFMDSSQIHFQFPPTFLDPFSRSKG